MNLELLGESFAPGRKCSSWPSTAHCCAPVVLQSTSSTRSCYCCTSGANSSWLAQEANQSHSLNDPLARADPFAKTVPDSADATLSFGEEDATVCCFDKRGIYLAVGYASGVIVIWDFVTRCAHPEEA